MCNCRHTGPRLGSNPSKNFASTTGEQTCIMMIEGGFLRRGARQPPATACSNFQLHATECLNTLLYIYTETGRLRTDTGADSQQRRRGGVGAAVWRRRCGCNDVVAAWGPSMFLSLAGRGVEHNRKQFIVGGLAGVRAYYT